MVLNRLSSTRNEYLENNNDSHVRSEKLSFYFEISHFLLVYDSKNDKYVIFIHLLDSGKFILKLFCMNPSDRLRECEQGKDGELYGVFSLIYHDGKSV